MATEPPGHTLNEYHGNPFIARLPPLANQRENHESLKSFPGLETHELGLPPHIRTHCIARLAKCFLPQARQVDLAGRFSLLLRQGYVGRNPLTHDYLRHVNNGVDRIEAGSLDARGSRPVENTATSFALLGCPGVGKTLAMQRVLAQYPQTIQHDEPFSLVQIVWLRLEAPALGSLRQLGLDFFQAVDQLVGTDYVKRYATRTTVEQMLLHMAHVAHLHALGVLVIDEIQNLRGAKVGAGDLMQFLVKLVNTIGLPVIPIGTMGALPILQASFSQARRSTGLGSLLWDRMAPDGVWDGFLKELWKYQWTHPATPLTPGLNAAMYDESQGVADLAVKLFMLVQLRLMAIAEVRPGQAETLTEELIRKVASEEFSIVAPMIDALRSNDAVKISKYNDLQSLNDHIGVVMGRAMQGEGGPAPGDHLPADGTKAGEPSSRPAAELALDSLVRIGVAADVARLVVDEAVAKNPSDDPIQLMSRITATLAASPPEVKPSRNKPPQEDEWPDADLRRIVARGKEDGHSAHEALLAAGVVRPPLPYFAA